MKASSFVFSGTIGAPIEEVFALLTDPNRIPEWMPACRSVKASGKSLLKGAKFSLRIQTPAGRVADIRAEVIEYARPTTFGWAEILPRAGSKTFFKLQFGGGSTEVTMKYMVAPRNMADWWRGVWLRRRQIEKEFDGAIQNLRNILTR